MSSVKEKILALVPKTCSCCGAPLELSADLMHLRCTNKDCGGSLYRRIEIMAKAFGIENIGVKTAKDMVEQIPLTSEYQLFDVSVEDIMKVDRLQKGMATKIYNSIHKIKQVPYAKFLKGVRIARVGEGTAEDLARVFPKMEDLQAASATDIKRKYDKAGDELGFIIAKSLEDRKFIIEELRKRVEVVYTDVAPAANSGILAVVTGSLHFGSRPEFQSYTTSKYGIRWTNAVSGNVNYLVTNETTETTKFKKAKELQAKGNPIKIVTEQEFLEILGDTSSVEALLSSTATAATVGDGVPDMFEGFDL